MAQWLRFLTLPPSTCETAPMNRFDQIREYAVQLGIAPAQVGQMIQMGILRCDLELMHWNAAKESNRSMSVIYAPGAKPGTVEVVVYPEIKELAEAEYNRGYSDGFADAEEDLS